LRPQGRLVNARRGRMFFFEKKNQKTFIPWPPWEAPAVPHSRPT
jgi:hypothetical protein